MRYVLNKMHVAKVLLLIFTISKLSTSFPSCAQVTHSDCGKHDSHILDEVTTQHQDECRSICEDLEPVCMYSLFDNKQFDHGNCRLYDGAFKEFINQCNELAGPRDLPDDCNLMNPPDNSCQVYRHGKCSPGPPEESEKLTSWENCHKLCLSHSDCQAWLFQREEGMCQIMKSMESSCNWEFSPREPSFDKCNGLPTTISPTTPSTPCEVPNPQEHGDWFCPPANDPATFVCHLECDSGYVSDNNTVTNCDHGVWDSRPTCIEAIALLTGSDDHNGNPDNTVEVYGKQLHKKLPNLPNNRGLTSLNVVNSLVLLCSGWDTEIGKSCLVMTSSQQWIPHSTLTTERGAHTGVSMLGRLYLLGGGRYYMSSTEYLEPPSKTWHKSWDLLYEGWSACSVKIEAQKFITVGGSGNSNTHARAAVMYNVTNGDATRLQDLGTERFYHGCAYIMQRGTGMRRVLVAGGQSSNHIHRSSEMYDLATGQWSITGDLTSIRSGLEMVVLGGDVFAMGGVGQDAVPRSVDRFNFTSLQWTAAESMLEDRNSFGVTGVPPSFVGIERK